MITSTQATFDIRNFTDRLTRASEKNRYICPVCGGNNLTINPKDGKYKCWNECECRDIREAISPWAEVTGERSGDSVSAFLGSEARASALLPSADARASIPKQKPILKSKQKPVFKEVGELKLARTQDTTDTPIPQKPQFVPNRVIEKFKNDGATPEELKLITVTVYRYSDRQAIHRFECPCAAHEKGHSKSFSQSHVTEEGKTKWTKGDEPWQAYRLDEAIAALENALSTPVLLEQEGERCVETVRKGNIASITWQGSNWGLEIDSAHKKIKSECPNAVIAFLKDNDHTGDKKAAIVKASCDRVGLKCIIVNPLSLCPGLKDKDDVVEILGNMEMPEFIRRLEEEIHKAVDNNKNKDSALPSTNDVPEAYDPNTEFLQIAKKALYGDKPWICINDKLYYWTGNHYKHCPDSVNRPRIAHYCNIYPVQKKGQVRYPYANPETVRKVLRWVKDKLEIDPDLINPPGLNCTNGVLQLHWVGALGDQPEFELIPHDPNLYYTYEPLVEYKPDADTTDCDHMLECLDPPQREVFLRTIASSLDLATVRMHKGRLVRGLLLKGDGNNGKDTLREAVSLMYGKLGLTSCTLSDFKAYDDGRKFPLSRLKLSRVNWSSENANTAALDKLQSIKAFLTGDTLSSEGKGKDELDYDPTSVGLFNVNDTPNLKGTLEAIASRWGVLSFNKTFKIGADLASGELEADPRFKYDPRFMRAQVLPAFLNRVLQALADLMREGIDYACTKKALESIQAENCHLFQFCQDVGLGYDPGSTVTAGEIWTFLEAWYQDNGILTYDGIKPLWAEQVKPSDKNVKACHQVIQRFLQLFPKAKRVAIPRQGGGKPVQGIAGLGFVISEVHTPASEDSTPILPLPVPPEVTQNQGLYPYNPYIHNPEERNQKQLLEVSDSNSNIESSPTVESSLKRLEGLKPYSELTLGVREGGETGVLPEFVGVREGGTKLEESAATIIKGTRVRVHCPGSLRDGKTGTVINVALSGDKRKAIVLVDDVEPHLKRFECFIPGTENMRIEALT